MPERVVQIGEYRLPLPPMVSTYRDANTGADLYESFDLPPLPGGIARTSELQWQQRERLPELYILGIQQASPSFTPDIVKRLDMDILRDYFFHAFGHATAIDVVLDKDIPQKPPVLDGSSTTAERLVVELREWATSRPHEALSWFKIVQKAEALKKRSLESFEWYGKPRNARRRTQLQPTYTQRWFRTVFEATMRRN